ncbi:MAG: hypothetical protein AAGH88_15835 [Planctomycetota bacterium]
MTALRIVNDESRITTQIDPEQSLLDALDRAGDKQRRKLEIWFAEVELTQAAIRGGWKIIKRNTDGRTGSSYCTFAREGETIVLRIADHLPAKPIGGRDAPPMLVAVIGCPDGLAVAARFLQRGRDEH